MVQHYRIIEKIGAGGMGEVYLAEDTSLHRKVALKFLPTRYSADADFKARFVREAEAMAKLNHPNIITIFEVSEFKSRPFFAMELVEGQSLRDLAKSKELSIDRIIELAIQVCEGLGAAHDKKIVHRDIKPSNIVIDAYGRPKILDFGLAAIQGGEHLTKTGSTLGTVQYMSPEQVQGQEVDHRSDLFSLGVVLYELISGRTPFERGNEGATLKAIANDGPEPLARYKSEVPDELQRIVAKLLEKDPAYRYQTATGVISDLKQELRSLTSDESTAAQTARVKRSAGKSLLKWFLPAAVIIFVTIALVLKPWKFEISPSEVARAAENRVAIMYFDNLADSSDSLRLGDPAGEVGAAARLAEQLAPGIFTGEYPTQEFLFMHIRAMFKDSRCCQHSDTGPGDAKRIDRGEFFFHGGRKHSGQIASIPLFWPGRNSPTGICQLVAPIHQGEIGVPVIPQPGPDFLSNRTDRQVIHIPSSHRCITSSR
ncbi:MAG: serine/threonine protein kinase [candidate division Zixibacteria bacterium]|nr:serine/threonine protein kinase [candidate division Zixibacteria bacterium]